MSVPVPWLSIVMPVLDEANAIEATLAALIPWRIAGAEVLVVDGGSTDNTSNRAQARADGVLAGPRGRALQMNAGAAASRGALLLFLHADTRLPDAALPRLRSLAGQRLWGRFDIQLDGAGPLLRMVERLMNVRSRVTGIATGDQAMFVSRDLFQDVGGFPGIPLMEDIALSSTLLRHCRPRCLRERVVTSSRRWEQGGVLRTILLMWTLRLGYFLGASPARLAAWYRLAR